MKVVAFGQQSRVGKDTAAQMLVSMMRLSNRYPRGVVKAGFAASLKHGAWLLWRQHGLMEAEFYDQQDNQYLRTKALPVIDRTPVELWIAFGQAVRGIWADTWVEAVLDRKDVDAVVISDLRFANEGERVKLMGGWRVKVERPGVTVRHGSDNEQLEFDEVIINDGSLRDLHDKIRAMAVRLELIA